MTTTCLRHCGPCCCCCWMLPWLLSILDFPSSSALAGFCVSFFTIAPPSHPCSFSKRCCLSTNWYLHLPFTNCLSGLNCLQSCRCLLMCQCLLFAMALCRITYNCATSLPLVVLPPFNAMPPHLALAPPSPICLLIRIPHLPPAGFSFGHRKPADD